MQGGLGIYHPDIADVAVVDFFDPVHPHLHFHGFVPRHLKIRFLFLCLTLFDFKIKQSYYFSVT